MKKIDDFFTAVSTPTENSIQLWIKSHTRRRRSSFSVIRQSWQYLHWIQLFAAGQASDANIANFAEKKRDSNHKLAIAKTADNSPLAQSGLPVFTYIRTGLHELTLSANKDVTSKGWTQFAMAMAAGCHLQSLYVDYNPLGDHSINSFAVAVATTKSLKFLDFEACDITNTGAQVNYSQ